MMRPEILTATSTATPPARAASDELADAAAEWIQKLMVKNGAYPPDSYPNPGKLPTSVALPLRPSIDISGLRHVFS